MSENQSIGKKIILDFLDFIRFKVENDTLTLEETESLSHMFENNLILTGTLDDIARFYGKPKENVKVVIDLESESPAYIAGDSARALADVVCELGCRHCH